MPESPQRRKWPYVHGQGGLVLPAVGMLLGSVLPWAYVLGRLLSASPTALMWTFWAGLVTLAAAVAPWRGVTIVSAVAGGATAVGFAVWQTGRVVELCGVSAQCVPGPGLGLLAVGGIAALLRGVAIARGSRSPPDRAGGVRGR